ncbi:MAG: SAM-dependent methyltransferase [Verrucomicrobiaceae bacterium]|nr:SAM-dependent methyltransferase [Verrucomicrobiaceae bacterium]
MQRALFDPQRGYYSRNIKTVGARGDFSTSATLFPALGKRIAAWLKDARNVIEIGAGCGELMEQVRRSLGLWRRMRMRFHIVETSPILREQQMRRLQGVTWHESIESALAATGGEAWIYHNELLDAFPATLVEWRGGRWSEVWLPEQLRTLGVDAEPFSALKHASFPEGQRCEIHPSIREWLQSGFKGWKRGQMLTIDYGDEFPALYHRRPGGTLRAYFMHQRLYWPDLLQNAGRMDLTADINFTDYRAWCRELGWEEISYQTMAQWAGAGESDGAGDAFKCLVHVVGDSSK